MSEARKKNFWWVNLIKRGLKDFHITLKTLFLSPTLSGNSIFVDINYIDEKNPGGAEQKVFDKLPRTYESSDVKTFQRKRLSFLPKCMCMGFFTLWDECGSDWISHEFLRFFLVFLSFSKMTTVSSKMCESEFREMKRINQCKWWLQSSAKPVLLLTREKNKSAPEQINST